MVRPTRDNDGPSVLCGVFIIFALFSRHRVPVHVASMATRDAIDAMPHAGMDYTHF